MTERWAVVGGGVVGLSLAEGLSAAGRAVDVLEAAPEIGGLAAAWQIGPVQWDKFYHVIANSDDVTLRLIDRLGLSDQLQWQTTRTGFYGRGRLHSLSSSIDFARFPLLGPIEKVRLACTILYASRLKDWKRLEDLSVGAWLTRLSGRGVYRRIWKPLLQAKLGDAADRTNAAFIWAYIDRMYKARRNGLKREQFGYVSGGYARVLKAWHRQLSDRGVEFRQSAAVDRVEYRQGQWWVSAGGTTESYDRVVFSSNCQHIAAACPDLSPHVAQRLREIDYLGVICTSLLLKRPLAGYYVTNLVDGDVDLTGIIDMSVIVPPSMLGGLHLVYLPQYVLADDRRWGWDDSQVQTYAIEQLRKVHPALSLDDIVAQKTARAKAVMAIPSLGYSRRVPPTLADSRGLYICNSAQIVSGTLNINESLQLSQRALPTLLAAEVSAA